MAITIIQVGEAGDSNQGLVEILRGLVEMQIHNYLGSRMHRASCYSHIASLQCAFV